MIKDVHRSTKAMDIEKKPSKVLKFSPVKVLVIESNSEYYRAVACSIAVGLCHGLIGATVMVVFMYSLQTRDFHAVLCTFGYQFCTAEAILCLGLVNGWSTNLKVSHRKIAHIVLQICSFGCVLVGLVLRISPQGPSSSIHCKTGLATCALTLLSIITSQFGLREDQYIKLIHMGFGLPTFIMSSVTVCLGFHTLMFRLYTDTVVVYILTSFTIFYTICISTVTIVHKVLKLI